MVEVFSPNFTTPLPEPAIPLAVRLDPVAWQSSPPCQCGDCRRLAAIRSPGPSLSPSDHQVSLPIGVAPQLIDSHAVTLRVCNIALLGFHHYVHSKLIIRDHPEQGLPLLMQTGVSRWRLLACTPLQCLARHAFCDGV